MKEAMRTDLYSVNQRALRFLLLALALLPSGIPAPLLAEGLAIGPADIRLEAREDGAYDLYVRQGQGLASILLTESTKDPAMKADNFAYRAPEFNEVNGREKRMLNGKALPPSSKLYSLISSTPLPDAAFGRAFRILIPPVLVYGYPWSRSGSVAVGKGAFINIRAFAKPYADYAGAFRDNPYEISISAKPSPPPPPAEPEQPQQQAPPPPADDRTSSRIGAAIGAGPSSLDLVVCLDTTQSMEPYIGDIKKNLGPIIRARVAGFKSFRIGLVLFKDYWPDEYITRKYPFTSDIGTFELSLKSIAVMGGRDIPEAVYEALFASATEFDWQADRRQIVFVGDAPPHPEPRGKIGFADVARAARDRGIELDPIIEPAKMTAPAPEHDAFENEARRLASLAASGFPVRLLGAPSTDPRIASLGAGAAPGASDEAALKAAAEAGATHLVLARTLELGPSLAPAMSETLSRLLEVKTGAELERDVLWRAGSEAVFVNGVRVK
jgi:hypothetical protein